MTHASSDVLLRHIRNLAAPGAASDGELLRRFAGRREEDAFAALVRRHGPMVLGVCRRVLGNAHDAEDAFQAAFLALARKASSLRNLDSVAAWVYRVAYRAALRARARAGRRHAADRAVLQEHAHEDRTAPDPLGEVTGRELSRVLDEELSRLPEKWRAPLVLCYLEGATRDEAAVRLGWPLGTLKHRLEKARAVLRGRLTRRGLALSAVLRGALLAGEAARAVPPVPLVDRTVRAALAAGLGGAAAGFVGRALRAALVLLAVTIIGAGAVLLAHRPPADAGPQQSPAPPAPQQAKVDKGEEIAVSGLVVGPDGKPAAGAKIAVILVGLYDADGAGKAIDVNRLQEAKADEEGRFAMQVARPAGVRDPMTWIMAAAPGFGFGWSYVRGGEATAEVVIRLRPERTLRGRVLDVEGQPVAGARVHVARAELSGEVSYVNGASNEVPWPTPVTTGADGRFALAGVGRDVAVSLDVTHEHFAPETLAVESADKTRADDIPIVLTPARTLGGRVVAADTGKPVAGVRLHFQGYAKDYSRASGGVVGRTDDDGRFSVHPYRSEAYATYVEPPTGRPYLGVQRRIDWPKGVVKHEVTLELPPGAVVGGTVADENGKPVTGAAVSYCAADGNPKLNAGVVPGGARTGRDGTYRLTVIPGAGYLLVAGPTPDYIRRELYAAAGFGGLSEEAKGSRVSPAGFARVDVKDGARPDDVTVKLRRGVTVEGKLTDPDGKPVARAKMLSALLVHPVNHQFAVGEPAEVRGGTFRLRGCDPEKTYTVLFFAPEKELGAAVELSAKKAAGEPVTVRLAPCGSAAARLIRRDGTPLKDFPQPPQYFPLELIVTPGTPHNFASEKAAVFADAMPAGLFDAARYQARHTDGEGRVTLPALIPGATYRVTAGYDPKEGFRYKDFRAEAGKRLDLGDLKLNW